MLQIGYTLSSEEHNPNDLIKNAVLAEKAGFAFASISDHYHPWVDAQGQSPFVWSVIGGISAVTKNIKIGTGVTCPTIRIHPAIIAQAAATCQVMLEGRFYLGVGTGENLNEHVVGSLWPPIRQRQEMLAESIEVMKKLWLGDYQYHYGKYFKVDGAKIYTLPKNSIPIMVAAKGPVSAQLAGEYGDGLISTAPDKNVTRTFDIYGGEGKPKIAQFHICYAKDKEQAKEIAAKIWPSSALPDPLNVELRLPKDFQNAVSMLSKDVIVKEIPLGEDKEGILKTFEKYQDAGFDHIYIHNIGPYQKEFLEFFAKSIMPKIKDKTPDYTGRKRLPQDKMGMPVAYAHQIKKIR